MKHNSKWIKDLAKTIKHLEENTGTKWHDLELGNGFLAMKSKGTRNNIKKTINWTSLKFKTAVPQKTPSWKWKDNTQNGKKYLQIIYVMSDLYLEHINNS